MPLYDAYGRPIKTQDLTREHAAPTLTGVRTIWNETVAGGLTPMRLAAVLRDAADGDHDTYLTLAEEMEERDLHYACELSKRKLAVSRLPITVESYSDASKDVEMADAVRDIVRKPGFRNLLKDMLDALGKGFSVCEIMWDRSGKRWTPAGYEWRDPHFFLFDHVSLSKIRLRDEENLSEGIDLAAYKFIRHLPRIKSGIPIRGGIARIAAWAWMCKGYTIKDWLAFAEVFGMPLRLGKYQAGASEDDKAVLRMAVANLGSDAAAIFPASMEVELVEAAKAGSTDFFQLLADYLDAQVSRGILGQTATTQGTPGKLGNEEAQKEVREDIRDDDAEQLEATLGRDLVKPFIDLNFGPQENYPEVQLRMAEKEDVVALSDSLAKLVPLGLRVEQSVIRDKLGLPDPDDDAEILTTPGGSTPASEALNRALWATIRSPLRAALNREDDIDRYADEALDEWQPVMRPLVDPIREALEASADAADFQARLAGIFENQNPESLVDSLAEALFRARLKGAENVD